MSEWQSLTWGDVATLEYGKSLRDYKTAGGNVPVYGTNGPIGFTDKALCNQPGVVIGRKGAYRGVHYSDRPFYVIDTAFYLKPKGGIELDTLFSYYQLLTKNINSMDSGSAIPSTSREDFYNLDLDLPPIAEQEAIAEILSSLDEKIELNRKQNRALEAIAQALFKRWFVEFEFPNENGLPYKSSGGAMQPSELGEIPVGWVVIKVSDAIEVLGGGTPSTTEEEYWTDGQIDWYSPTDLTKSGALFSFSSAKKITEQGLANSSAKLFPEYSLMMTSRATIGVISINSNRACTNQGFITLLPNDEFPLYMLHGWLLQQLPEVHAKASGSTFKEISRGTFKGFDVLKSPEAAKYQELVEPIYRKIESNLKESEKLAAIRDTLLPKLMSGELRVA